MLTDLEKISDDDIRGRWQEAHVSPLWENAKATDAHHQEPAPNLWSWRTMQPLIANAIAATSPAIAERRALSLIDPSARPREFQTITNLNAALQILLPGEVARPHRHSMDALRFVLEGAGGVVTRVNGKLAPMALGDLVLTPGTFWHEHWHEGTEPMVWLDVLNAHTHIMLGTFWFEPGPVHDEPSTLSDDAFEVPNFVPDIERSDVSPVFRYTFADAKRAVDAAPLAKDGSRRVRYANPLTGGPVIPYLDCYLMRLDAGESTIPFRTTAHAVCAVVEGSGTTATGGGSISWENRDVFTLPHGTPIVHTATETSYVFIVTDREYFSRLGLLREEFSPSSVHP
jgi:gentisate 1,2-dioxygenase